MAPTYLLIVLFVAMVASHPREILVDEESSPSLKANTMRAFVTDDETAEDEATCHMEYQVVKRVAGHCMKLGRSARGCVAGNYLQPFHPECI